MQKILEAIRLKETSDLSERAIGGVLKISPTTVGRYWSIYSARGWKLVDLLQMTYDELDSLFNQARRRLTKKRLPDWTYIHRMMRRKHQTLERLWEDYRLSDPIDAFSYSQFTHHYRKFAVRVDLVMRQTHLAGDAVFVDFTGSTIPWIDAATGEKHKAQVFVAVMGCSNYTFVRAAESQASVWWIDLHNHLFAFLGGVPATVVPDNLRSAVQKAGRQPLLNRTYWELARHYDTVILPARPGKPRDKGKVETGVRFVSRWIIAALDGRQFFSVDEINVAIAELLPRLNQKLFRKLPGCRQSWFEEMDRPALKPLPEAPFEHAEWTAPMKVPADYHVLIGQHYYSVPCALVQSYVEACVTATRIEVFQGGKRVTTHALSQAIGGHTTLPEHQPPAHRAYAAQTPENFQEWAESIGPAALAVVRQQFHAKPHTQIGIRACATLKGLARNYGPERFEAACDRAQEIGSLTVKSVRSILQRGLDARETDETPVMTHLPSHQNIRGSDYYSAR
jgi:transposase